MRGQLAGIPTGEYARILLVLLPVNKSLLRSDTIGATFVPCSKLAYVPLLIISMATVSCPCFQGPLTLLSAVIYGCSEVLVSSVG